MKLAIISDVHSNLHALDAVIEELARSGAERVVCAGDVVGYCAFPNECCRIVKKLAMMTVVGNHDHASLTRDTSGANPYAARAILWTSDVLSEDSKTYLRSLEAGVRFGFDNKRFAMFHGSPRSIVEYIFPEDVDDSLLNSADASVLILGHTHVPFVQELRTGLFVNPGGVGQPRDGDPRASFAVYDSKRGNCEIKRVSYDIQAAAEAIIAEGLPTILANRLFVGK